MNEGREMSPEDRDTSNKNKEKIKEEMQRKVHNLESNLKVAEVIID